MALVVCAICTCYCCVSTHGDDDEMAWFAAVLAPLVVYAIVLLSFWAACHISDDSKLAAFWVTMVVFAVLFVLYFGGCAVNYVSDEPYDCTAGAVVIGVVFGILSIALLVSASINLAAINANESTIARASRPLHVHEVTTRTTTQNLSLILSCLRTQISWYSYSRVILLSEFSLCVFGTRILVLVPWYSYA